MDKNEMYILYISFYIDNFEFVFILKQDTIERMLEISRFLCYSTLENTYFYKYSNNGGYTMAKFKYAKNVGKSLDEVKRSEPQILGKASEESLKERRQIASELKRKQGETAVKAGDIFIGSIKDKEP